MPFPEPGSRLRRPSALHQTLPLTRGGSAWTEADGFSQRERAALAWCEALALIAETHAPDSLYEELARNFESTEIAVLTVAITTINSWNRLNIGLRAPHRRLRVTAHTGTPAPRPDRLRYSGS